MKWWRNAVRLKKCSLIVKLFFLVVFRHWVEGNRKIVALVGKHLTETVISGLFTGTAHINKQSCECENELLKTKKCEIITTNTHVLQLCLSIYLSDSLTWTFTLMLFTCSLVFVFDAHFCCWNDPHPPQGWWVFHLTQSGTFVSTYIPAGLIYM